MKTLIRIEIDPETGDVSFYFSDAPEEPFSAREFVHDSKTRVGLIDLEAEIEDYRIAVEGR